MRFVKKASAWFPYRLDRARLVSATAALLLGVCSLPSEIRSGENPTHMLALTRLREALNRIEAPPQADIQSVSRTSGMVTIALDLRDPRARTFRVGDRINVSGLPDDTTNGTFELVSKSGNQLTFEAAGPDASESPTTGGTVRLDEPAVASLAVFGDSYALGLIPTNMRRELFLRYGFRGAWCGSMSRWEFGGYKNESGAVLNQQWSFHTNGQAWNVDLPGEYFHIGTSFGPTNRATFIVVSPTGGSIRMEYKLSGEPWVDAGTRELAPGHTLETAVVEAPEVQSGTVYRIVHVSGEVITSGGLVENTTASGVIQADLHRGGIDMQNTNTMPPENLGALLRLLAPDLITWDMADSNLSQKIPVHQTLWDSAYPTDWLFITPQPNTSDLDGLDALTTIAHARANGQDYWSILPQLPTFEYGDSRGWYADQTHLSQLGSEALYPRLWQAMGLLEPVEPLHGILLDGVANGSSANSGEGPDQAFDTDFDTSFVAMDDDPAWVGVDLGAGSNLAITEIHFAPRVGDACRLEGGRFEGAQQASFSDAITLATVLEAPFDSAIFNRLDVNDPNAYRYIRYVAPDGEPAILSELRVFGLSAPSTPGSLTTRLVDGTATLAWTEDTNADSYTVRRGSDAEGPFEIVASGLDVPEFSESGLEFEETYYYVVSSVNAAGEGSPTQAHTALDRYNQWLAGQGAQPGSVDTAFDEDVDGNGESNGVGYSLLTDLEMENTSEGVRVFVELRQDPDLTFELLISSDLSRWTHLSFELASDQEGVPQGWQRHEVELKITSPADPHFFQIRISR